MFLFLDVALYPVWRAFACTLLHQYPSFRRRVHLRVSHVYVNTCARVVLAAEWDGSERVRARAGRVDRANLCTYICVCMSAHTYKRRFNAPRGIRVSARGWRG